MSHAYRAVDVIRKKRDGNKLGREELGWFCRSAGIGEIPDYQISAFLMAAYFQGMTEEETAWFTAGMVHSGDVVHLDDVPGVKVDKHSTGGVGDTTTLVVAPLAAACGLMVAKMSGRGLGHTGGTLDKLESIPGMRTQVSLNEFKDQVRRIGLAVVSQTGTLVPADSKFYALRDVTATIDSIPLIASSVMSKKLAAGAEVIVLDVKCGRGAFMQTVEDARKLSQLMVAIGTHLGRHVRAVITRMDVPLGTRIGNALEVQEAIEILQGKHVGSPLYEVSLALCSHLLVLGRKAADLSSARQMAETHLSRGDALEKLRRMILAQGGDGKVVDDTSRLPHARERVSICAGHDGFVTRIDALEIGEAACLLGAGRLKKEDAIDPGVGVELLAPLGSEVHVGQAVAELHVNDATHLDEVRRKVLHAYHIGPKAPHPEPLIVDTVQ